MEKLYIKCSGCGDSFTIAIHHSKSDSITTPRTWGASLDLWLNDHWNHIDVDKPISEAFTLEGREG
jgi:hypothetical protein